MKVSVIVPIYNVEQYIAECLQSILVQDYSELECILVNDCTSDRSMDIVKETLDGYSGPITIKVIHQERNLGLSAARNTGVEAASGDYVFFIDSDDYLLSSSAISSFVHHAFQYPDAEIITGRWSGFRECGNYPMNNKVILESIDDYKQSILFFYFYGTAWNRLIKRSFIVNFSLTFENGYIFEDTLWDIKTFPYLRMHVVIPETTYYYRPNPTGIIKEPNTKKTYKSRVHLVDNVFHSQINNRLKVCYFYFITQILLASSCMMSERTPLDESDISNYRRVRSMFRRQIMFSHPLLFVVGLMLYKPFRLFLDNGVIRSKAFTVLVRYKTAKAQILEASTTSS